MRDNPYPLINDAMEAARLDNLQRFARTLFGQNVVAPIGERPSQILDLGAGSGPTHFCLKENS
jgi:hypothetical protein